MVFKLKSVFLGIALCFSVLVQAQSPALKQNLPAIDSDKVLIIEGYNSAMLNAEDNNPNKKKKILNIGRFLPQKLTLKNSGQWDKTKKGKVWRLQVVADKAKGISFFGKVKHMPKGATLNIYSADGKEWVNSYTAKDFKTNTVLSSATVAGEAAIIEYYEPEGVKQGANLVIEGVGYMYRHNKAPTNSFQRKNLGASGACQVNVNCSEGNDWKKQRDAVVRIRAVSDFIISNCTGTLVRTTDKKYKPYLLSAMHCALRGAGDSLINDTLFNYWTFTFNYQSPTCANPFNDSNFNKQIITGSKVLAHSDDRGGELGSDFLLVELNEIVPPDYKAYYAGWNLDVASQFNSGVCIHHPNYDIKKISTYTWPLSFEAPFQTSPDDTHWETLWSSTVNGHGVTEPGSSGSAIFDKDGLILGTLTGGSSSCSNTGATDVFGRMDWHWTKNGNDSTLQLRYWLDPLNTGVTRFEGAYDELRNINNIAFLPLQITPNPTQNVLGFSSSKFTNETKQIRIVDVLGKQYYPQSVEANRVDVSAYPSGIYFIFVKQGERFFKAKFVKQ